LSHLTGDIVGFFKGQPIPTTVKYFPAQDPYAIVFVFFTPNPIQWIFARDLLVEGIEVPVGVGDVKFRPAGDHVIMSISDEAGGDAEFSFLKTDIQAIIEIAQTMMPRGKESEAINWDSELEVLFNGETNSD
jgi:hypothetical protein